MSVYNVQFPVYDFNFTEYYETSGHTEKLTDSTILVTNDKLTTSDTFSSMFYHTSECGLFTKSDNVTPLSNQE